MDRKSKVKILAITFAVGNKTHTAAVADFARNNHPESKGLIPHNTNVGSNDDGDFKCINSEWHIKVCFGGDCHWAPTGTSC